MHISNFAELDMEEEENQEQDLNKEKENEMESPHAIIGNQVTLKGKGRRANVQVNGTIVTEQVPGEGQSLSVGITWR